MKNKITFIPLKESHLCLLQKWLNQPHVNPWWGKKEWTAAAIKEKYLPYTVATSKVKAFIIQVKAMPIGYIQYYAVKDFPKGLPFDIEPTMAGIDFLIGEESYLAKGFAVPIIMHYSKDCIPKQFTQIIADPLIDNKRSINLLKKLGFKEFSNNNTHTYYLLKI